MLKPPSKMLGSVVQPAQRKRCGLAVQYVKVQLPNPVTVWLEHIHFWTSPHFRIRLLSFDPNGDLNLETFDTTNRPEYNALSYEWGPKEPLESIRLNKTEFPIRRNLYLALAAIRRNLNHKDVEFHQNYQSSLLSSPGPLLHTLRGSHNCKYFWVDALCIDQENIDERSHQVGLMASIYSEAIFVVVWLGPYLDQPFDAVKKWDSSCDLSQKWASSNYFLRNFDTSDTSDTPRRHHLDVFFCASYWTRLWIAQEFVLAKDVIFLSDSQILPWSTLREKLEPLLALGEQLDDLDGRSVEMAPHYTFMYDVVGTKVRAEEHDNIGVGELEFLQLVTDFAHHSCADSRDKIYSLIGIAQWDSERSGHDNTQWAMSADYSLSPPELFSLMELRFECFDIFRERISIYLGITQPYKEYRLAVHR